MSETGDEFTALFLPVKACYSVCTDLNEKIKQASLAGLQDWTSLKYRGANIAGLINKLKLYITTIVIKMIAVASSSGTFTLAPSFLQTYRDLLEETQWGLPSDMKNTLDEFEQETYDTRS